MKLKINHKATITKGQPMPCICEICSSVHAIDKNSRNLNEVESNSCYVPEQWVRDYQPFTNSKRKVKVICDHFAHMRSFKAW